MLTQVEALSMPLMDAEKTCIAIDFCRTYMYVELRSIDVAPCLKMCGLSLISWHNGSGSSATGLRLLGLRLLGLRVLGLRLWGSWLMGEG